MRDEDKENLFKALNEVRELMQSDDTALHNPAKTPKFSVKDESILELAGHEIHDTTEEILDPTDESLIEEIFIGADNDRIDEINLSLEEEDPRDFQAQEPNEVYRQSENKIREMIESLEHSNNKSEQPFILEEIVQQTAKPYILKWLDQNLESVVREVVEIEVAKILKKVKK